MLIDWPQFPAGSHTYDLTTVICPCREAAVWLDDHPLAGRVKTTFVDEQLTSSAFLAFAETWVGPHEVHP